MFGVLSLGVSSLGLLSFVTILPLLYRKYDVAGDDVSATQRWQNVAMVHRRNTLVLVVDYHLRDTHSLFFRSLRSRGHKLTFKLASDPNVTLHRYNELRYDNVVLFAPAVEQVDGGLDAKSLLRFVDQGGNLLVAVDEGSGILMRELAAECGIEIDAVGSSSAPNYVVDHFRHVVADPTHTTLAVHPRNLINAPVIVGPADAYTAPILYRGIPLLVDDAKPAVVRVLTADGTSFTSKLNENSRAATQPQSIGTDVTLVAATQMANNARVVFSGSLAMFSDAFALQEFTIAEDGSDNRYAKSANDRLTDSLSRWSFQETGVLRVVSVSHHRASQRDTPAEYTINERTVFEIELTEKANDEWIPLRAGNLYVEFTRIHPFVRTKLMPVGDGRYRGMFVVPDVYGIFKFVVDYKRVGYSFVFVQIAVPVKPLRHTQYERFVLTAYPYYVAAFSMMIMTLVFSCVFLHADLADKSKNE